MNNKGKNNPNYKHGKFCKKHYCLICHKEINVCTILYGSHKCKSCIRIGMKTKKHKDFYCLDCNKKISYGRKRCKSCNMKYQIKRGVYKNINYKGSNNPNWKGGITKLVNCIRNTTQYKLWIKKVFKKDNYTCQVCYKRGYELNAHHKFPLSDILVLYSILTMKEALKCKLLWDINNGITLCRKHHEDIEPRLKNSKNRLTKKGDINGKLSTF